MHPSKLHVISVISNPIRYRSRYDLYRNFEKHVVDAGAVLHTVELAFGERPHVVTSEGHERHYRFRTVDEIWHKENMVNVALGRLPHDWKYVAWVDADVMFTRPDWASETVHQLQHYEVVQMWSVAQDLTPGFEPYQTHYSFAHCMLGGDRFQGKGPARAERYGGWYHPGYAWAATREAINHLGGLLDVAAMGAADNHMAHCLYGIGEESIPEGVHPNYRKAVLDWQERARYLHRDIGCVPGLINHYFHGKKRDRRYHDRWKVITENQFDPQADLTRDWQGIWQVRPERIKLRDDMRAYFRARNEDSIDID
jgi:hypothetical protein